MGFSNLAALASNNAPPPAVQPVIPATAVSPSVFSMGLSSDGTLSQPGLNPSNTTPASQPQPYVIPQMRNSSGGAPQPLMNNLQPPPAGLPPLNRRNKRFSGCIGCVAQNTHCTHCWFCGQGDHKMEVCPTRQQAALNAQARAAGNFVEGLVDGMLQGNG